MGERKKKDIGMRVLIIGAKLQGIEAALLAGKAGYQVTVLDRNSKAPGVALGNRFVQADVFDEERMPAIFRQADVVLPAVENTLALKKILEYGRRTGAKVIFDENAYAISSSKVKSNEVFKEENLPIPQAYPECGYPVILKPDGLSGSRHVSRAHSREEVEQYLQRNNARETLAQEYLQGRSYSLEVIGDGENYYFPQITEVVVDKAYDCKRIIAPAQIADDERRQMLHMGKTLAERLRIRGIFDMEAISDRGRLKLLEIDARLPSQTPVSVWHSSGINMVEALANLALGRKEEAEKAVRALRAQVCIYQQIRAADGKIEVLGEHIMSESRRLRLAEDFFGATEAVTDYQEGCKDFRAIVITVGKDHAEAKKKFVQVIANIKRQPGLENWEFIEG